MNEAITILCSAVGVAGVVLGAALWHGRTLGNIETRLQGVENKLTDVSSVWQHVSNNENRLTKIETEHKCCRICRENGKTKDE